MTNNGHCIICYRSINGKNHVPFKTTPNTKLESQLNVIFILKHIFKLRLSQLEAYIQKWGNPEEWVIFCKNCEEDVTNLRMVYGKLQNISWELERGKWNLTEKIRISVSEEAMATNVKNGDKSATHKILTECRSNFLQCYVRNPPRQPPPKKAGYEGDIVAALKLKSQESVKSEVDQEFNDGSSGVADEDSDVDATEEEKEESETATTPENAEGIDIDEKEDGTPGSHVGANGNSDSDSTPAEPEPEPEESDSDGGIKWEKCHLCPNRYETKTKLKQHIDRFHLRKYLSPCPHCSNKSSSATNLKIHLARMHGIGKHLKCEKCYGVYFTQEGFENHACFPEKRSNSTLKLKCKVEGCSAILRSARDLSRHIRTIHDTVSKPSFQCHNCGDSFQTRYSLKMHFKRVHENKSRLTCHYDKCSKTFVSKQELNIHLRKVHEGNSSAKSEVEVGQEFNDGNSGVADEDEDSDGEGSDDSTEEEMRESETATNPKNAEVAEEMDIEEKEDDKDISGDADGNLDSTPTKPEPESEESDGGIKLETCHLCPNRYETKTKLKQHIDRFHLRKYLSPCPHCNNKSSSATTLKIHLARMHGIGKHLKCEKCYGVYFTQEGFENHACSRKKISDSRLKLKCKVEGCSAILRSSGALSRHVRAVHDTGSKTRIQCHYCGKHFQSRSRLTLHFKRVHENKSRLTCHYDKCSKTFVSKHELNIHLRKVHEGYSRPIACQFCGETFAGRSSVEKHEQEVHQSDKI